MDLNRLTRFVFFLSTINLREEDDTDDEKKTLRQCLKKE